MVGVALAFFSSMFWGGSDFVAGIGARRVGALRTSLWAYLGAVILSGLAYLVYPGTFSTQAAVAGFAAGLCNMAGLISFYASMVLAPMGAVAAIVAAAETVLPIVVGIGLRGEGLLLVGWIGAGIATAGAVLVGAAEGDSNRAGVKAVLLAAFAGVSFGLAVVVLDFAPENSGFLAPAVEMLGGFGITTLLVAAIWRSRVLRGFAVSTGLTTSHPADKRSILLGVSSGVLQGIANIVLMLALWTGQLSIVGVIVCLYPLTTALLARLFLKEILTRGHLIGITLALSGCVLLAMA